MILYMVDKKHPRTIIGEFQLPSFPPDKTVEELAEIILRDGVRDHKMVVNVAPPLAKPNFKEATKENVIAALKIELGK